MTDFKKSFEEGIAAAENAERRRKEVEGVIAKLAADVHEASSGAIFLGLGSDYEVVDKLSIYDRMNGVRPEAKRFDAIVASNRNERPRTERVLSRVSFSPNTYPVTLQWEEQHFFCQDALGIEKALAELLRDPRTGKKLGELQELARKADSKIPDPG